MGDARKALLRGVEEAAKKEERGLEENARKTRADWSKADVLLRGRVCCCGPYLFIRDGAGNIEEASGY